MPTDQNPVSIATRPGTDADVPAVVAIMAEAFANDPVLGFVLDDGPASEPDRRRALLAAFFANRLLGGRGIDEIVVPADPVDAREAAAVWISPRSPEDAEPDFSMLRAVNDLTFGADTMEARITALIPVFAVHPTTPHWYLPFVGTRPSARGRGLASAVISAVTRRCDAEGVGAYLESSDPANVPLYERHGFVVTAEIAIEGGPTVPVMWRDPVS
ncbi:MAG: GNAT family N-acetyltransferase [Actinomycetota bacterium]|nr:GNAT family N-acetyltransferase [Actinomycetota bacterium]